MLDYRFDFRAELFDKRGKRLIFIGLSGEGDIAGYNHDYMVYLVWNLSQARSHGRSGLKRGRDFKVDITDMEDYESHVFPLLACCIQDVERGWELSATPDDGGHRRDSTRGVGRKPRSGDRSSDRCGPATAGQRNQKPGHCLYARCFAFPRGGRRSLAPGPVQSREQSWGSDDHVGIPHRCAAFTPLAYTPKKQPEIRKS